MNLRDGDLIVESATYGCLISPCEDACAERMEWVN